MKPSVSAILTFETVDRILKLNSVAIQLPSIMLLWYGSFDDILQNEFIPCEVGNLRPGPVKQRSCLLLRGSLTFPQEWFTKRNENRV